MKQVLLIAAGGAIGSVSRYTVAVLMKDVDGNGFPWPTFLVNVAGCFLIGWIYASFLNSPHYETIRVFVMIGMLGGFTTFSSFGLEVLQLIKQKMLLQAFAYIVASTGLGILAAFSGYSLKS